MYRILGILSYFCRNSKHKHFVNSRIEKWNVKVRFLFVIAKLHKFYLIFKDYRLFTWVPDSEPRLSKSKILILYFSSVAVWGFFASKPNFSWYRANKLFGFFFPNSVMFAISVYLFYHTAFTYGDNGIPDFCLQWEKIFT